MPQIQWKNFKELLNLPPLWMCTTFQIFYWFMTQNYICIYSVENFSQFKSTVIKIFELAHSSFFTKIGLFYWLPWQRPQFFFFKNCFHELP